MSALFHLLQRLQRSPLALAVTSRINTKLLLSFAAVSLLPCLALGLLLRGAAHDALTHQAVSRLQTIQQSRVIQVEHRFQRLQEQLRGLSQDALLVDSMRQLPDLVLTARDENQVDASQLTVLQEQLLQHYNEDFTRQYNVSNDGAAPPVADLVRPLDPDSIFLQHQYIRANPHPLGRKAALERAQDFSRYSELHARLHPFLRQVLQVVGCEDILLVDIRSGDVVYSVEKQVDFTTSLIDGPYAQSGLGKAFRQASVGDSSDACCFVDYEPYRPACEEATSFLASPIFSGEKAIGVMIFKLALDQIPVALADSSEKAGALWLAASADRVHYDSRSSTADGSSEGSAESNAKAAALQAALRGESGDTIVRNQQGENMLIAWSPVPLPSLAAGDATPSRWALVSEWRLSDLDASVLAVGAWRKTMLIAAFALFLGVAAAWSLGRGLTSQAAAIARTLTSLGQGNTEARSRRLCNDELGELATKLNSVCESQFVHASAPYPVKEIQQSLADLMNELERIAAGDLTIKTRASDDMIGPLATSINYMIGQLREVVHNAQYATSQVGVSATRIQAAAEHLYRGSASQTRQITGASNAVEDLAQLIQQAALDSIEMASAAGEIRQDAVRGSTAMKQAMLNIAGMRHHTQETTQRMKQLCERLQEASESERWISDIAARVGILSLNASIHAAAAGEAHPGFTAVAEGLQQLSERSESAAKRAASMHKSILAEADKARHGIEHYTREVVECTRVSAEAARLVGDLESAAGRWADRGDSHCIDVKQQSRTADAIAAAMNEAAQASEQNTAVVKQAVASINQLVGLTDNLQRSLKQFRVVRPSTLKVTGDSPVGLVGAASLHAAETQAVLPQDVL